MLHRLAIFVFLVGAQFSLPHQTRTCEPRPDYWFAERYAFEPVHLPESIELVQSPQDAAVGDFQISNLSNLSLYVLPMDAIQSLVATVEPSFTGDGLSEEQTSEEIFLLDRATELAAFVLNSDESLTLDLESLTALVPYIEERNIIGFSRPSFVYLPITQRGEFHLVFGDQLITVPFTISYALNENFNPEVCGEEIEPATQQEVSFDEESNNSILISTIAFGTILLVTLGAIIWIRKR